MEFLGKGLNKCVCVCVCAHACVCVSLSDWFDSSMLTLLVRPCPLSKPYDSVPENEAALLMKKKNEEKLIHRHAKKFIISNTMKPLVKKTP